MKTLTAELEWIAREEGFELAAEAVDDVLTYALFGPTALKFLENRGNPAAFEPPPGAEQPAVTAPAPVTAATTGPAVYDVRVNGRSFTVEVSESGAATRIEPAAATATAATPSAGQPVPAPLAGTVFKVLVAPGDSVREGQPVLVLEAMKMETEVAAPLAGTVSSVRVKAGDAVSVGDELLAIG